MVDAKQVAAAKALRAAGHFLHRHATDSGSGNQRANTRSGVHTRLDSSLLESAENADMRKAFHSPAAKHECDALAAVTASLLYHRRQFRDQLAFREIIVGTDTARRAQRPRRRS